MTAVIDSPFATVYEGDALTTLRTLEADSVDCCVTSPPYWGLRDYGHAQQMGLEPSPFEYIEKMAGVFDEVRRVLKPSGTCWLVIGDSYAGMNKSRKYADVQNSAKQISNNGSYAYHGNWSADASQFGTIKPKDLCGIPWRLAFALQERGWYLRQDIIWAKPNPMPESVTDRCTRSHEYVFMLTKCARYAYDGDAISERSQWNGMSGDKNYRHSLNARIDGGMNSGTHNRRDSGIPRTFHNHDLAMSTGRCGDRIDGTRNRRDVWTIQGEPFPDAHFATFPTKLVELCIKAGCPPDGVVLDPFGGCGTTGEVAVKLGKRAILIELNPQYIEMIRKNLGLFAMATA